MGFHWLVTLTENPVPSQSAAVSCRWTGTAYGAHGKLLQDPWLGARSSGVEQWGLLVAKLRFGWATNHGTVRPLSGYGGTEWHSGFSSGDNVFLHDLFKRVIKESNV